MTIIPVLTNYAKPCRTLVLNLLFLYYFEQNINETWPCYKQLSLNSSTVSELSSFAKTAEKMKEYQKNKIFKQTKLVLNRKFAFFTPPLNFFCPVENYMLTSE